MEDGILKLSGAQEPAPDKYTSLATIKFIGGLQTQRSAFASIDTRYNSKFLGGKPDALIAGSNVEISNRLTLQRRPGVVPYGTANVPPPDFFYAWDLATTQDIILIVDTSSAGGDNNAGTYGAVFNYSPTSSGIYINKALGSVQTQFMDIVNTLYLGDGVDLYKVVGPNLLTQSNTFGIGAGTMFTAQAPWTEANVFSLTPGFTDPLGGTNATQITWGTTGSGAYLQQIVIPNYTPVASNTFTFSVWLQETGGAETVTLEIADQSGSIATTACVVTSSWVKYQVTGTMSSSSNEIKVLITSPTATTAINIYGAQLEIGGPATTTQITTTKPQGVYLWGIQAPLTGLNNVSGTTSAAPIFTLQQAVGNTGLPWQANHIYNVGDTIVDSNGNLQYATNGGVYPQTTYTVTSVASGTGIYQGTFTGGGANAFAGITVVISGFTTSANNGTFLITASTATQITTNNSSSSAQTQAATATFGVIGTVAGTSGSTQPTWNTQVAGLTQDGLQNIAVQSVSTPAPAAANTASVTFPASVTAGHILLVGVLVSHPQVLSITDTVSDTFVSVLTQNHGGFQPPSSGDSRYNSVSAGQYTLYLYYVQSAVGGTTTINVTGGGNTGTFIVAAEMQSLIGLDGTSTNSNSAIASGGTSFTTGGVQTVNAKDVVISLGAFNVSASAGGSAEIGSPPTGFTVINSTGPSAIASNTSLTNVTLAFQSVAAVDFYDPDWTIASPTTKSQNVGITAAFKTAVGTLEWYNLGQNGAGLTATIGYQYYYSYGNSYTGHFSNVSPISASTGAIIGQDLFVTGSTRTMTDPGSVQFSSALYNTDPQSDLVALYRNTNGGGFFYQVALFGNGATAQAALVAANYPGLTTTGVTYSTGTWTYEDTTPDVNLNTSIFAPIGLLNSLPPAGLKNMEYWAGRMWGSVNNILYYNTSADNASLLSVQQNGVPSESWIAINYIPFNAAITRIIALGGGLLVCTVLDIWFLTGQNLLTGGFDPQKVLAGHGLRSYNALSLDGSSVYLYTSDRQFLCINPNSGSVEFGFPIGDYLEENYNPLNVYIARHISGSQDNAVFMTDGETRWVRLNPNQQGASMSGEQTPVWSPEADFLSTLGGISAIGSIETSPGFIQLLIGQPGSIIANKTHSGNFTQGQQGATYTVTVTNASPEPTSGLITVTETVPAGLTFVSMSGSGWNISGNVATRNDILLPGASYPVLTVTVNVANNASSPQVNQITVQNSTIYDSTHIVAASGNQPTYQGYPETCFTSNGTLLLINTLGSPYSGVQNTGISVGDIGFISVQAYGIGTNSSAYPTVTSVTDNHGNTYTAITPAQQLSPILDSGSNYFYSIQQCFQTIYSAPFSSGTSFTINIQISGPSGPFNTGGQVSWVVLHGVNRLSQVVSQTASSATSLTVPITTTEPDLLIGSASLTNDATSIPASVLQITNTSLTGNIATYGYTLVSGPAPQAGQFITVSGTTNAGGIFNVGSIGILNVTPTTFTIGMQNANISIQSETGVSNVYTYRILDTDTGSAWLSVFVDPASSSEVTATNLNITSSQYSADVATFGYTVASGNPPILGQLVTTTGLTNGGGVLNLTNALIVQVNPTTILVRVQPIYGSLYSSPISLQSESGSGVVLGQSFRAPVGVQSYTWQNPIGYPPAQPIGVILAAYAIS